MKEKRRRIQFKATCNEHVKMGGRDYFGRWVYGEYGHFRGSKNKPGDAYIGDPKNMKCFAVDEDTVCQFTGFVILDERGALQEIYDGDILTSDCYPFHDGENPETSDSVAVVVWNQETVSFTLFVCEKSIVSNHHARQTFWRLNADNLHMYQLRVAGNIYDDTELSRTLRYFLNY